MEWNMFWVVVEVSRGPEQDEQVEAQQADAAILSFRKNPTTEASS
jgi:hypothetical protein